MAAGIFLTNDNGDDDETNTAGSQSSTTEASTTTSEATTSTTPPVTGPAAQLNDVSLVGGSYAVSYTWQGFEPDVEGGPDSLHFHFFLNTTAPENAGNNGNPPGDWHLTDALGEFTTRYGPENRGEATQMCVVVANSAHEVVDPASGNCLDLPE